MSKVHVFDHPLIQHKLSILRDKHTSVKEFRELISEIAMLMCFEATRDLPLEEIDVETPVATAHCKHIAGKKLAIVPILRAGLGMVDGMVTMMPNVKVGHIGLFRDPQTLEPVKYYFKMPPDIAERDVIIVDPHARHRRQRVCCGKIHEGSRLQAHQAHVHHWCARGRAGDADRAPGRGHLRRGA